MIEKHLWSEKDFASMEWHDCKIYAIALGVEEHEIMIDIDYILEWIKPDKNGNYFKFWVAPATLVFKNVYNILINIDSVNTIIDCIYRNNPVRAKNASYVEETIEYDWIIETINGEISFKSVGFTQYLRKKPVLGSQEIDLLVRGGISFERGII